MVNVNRNLIIKYLDSRQHCFQGGFGLVGLMVVIAIIGILAVIAIPSFQDYTARPKHSMLASANQAIAKLEWQEMVYSAPERMEIGSTSVVTVKLGGNKSFAELVSLLEKAGQTGGQRVEVSNRMYAHLVGNGFEITPVT